MVIYTFKACILLCTFVLLCHHGMYEVNAYSDFLQQLITETKLLHCDIELLSSNDQIYDFVKNFFESGHR